MIRLDKELFRPLVAMIKEDIDKYTQLEEILEQDDEYLENMNYSYSELDQFSFGNDLHEEEHLPAIEKPQTQHDSMGSNEEEKMHGYFTQNPMTEKGETFGQEPNCNIKLFNSPSSASIR